MSLPWDVFATPIAARKLARLGVEHDEVVLDPRSTGSSARRTARSRAPRARSTTTRRRRRSAAAASTRSPTTPSSGASAPTNPNWRCSRSNSQVAVIEHDHGYRASDQRVTSVQFHGACVRCGQRAEVFGRRHFGGLVPACHRCARHAVEPSSVSEALGVPVSFTTDDPAPSRLATRLEFVLAADHRARRHPAPHRCARARHRIGHPARLRPARDRRVAGHRSVTARSPRRAPRPRRHRSGAVATSLESGGRRGRDRV